MYTASFCSLITCLLVLLHCLQGSHCAHASKSTKKTKKTTTSPKKKKTSAKPNVPKSSKAKSHKVKSIEVRANAEKQADLKDPSGFVTWIPTKKAQVFVKDVAETVREHASVHVRSMGGLGAWSSVSIRGSSANQVQILLDGVPLNHGGSGMVALGQLPLDSLNHIEIYRGFVPVHLGGAIGGAIHLQTRYPKTYQKTNITLSSGSFRTLKGNVFHAQRKGPWQWTLFAGALTTTGDFPYYDDHGTPLDEQDDLPEALRLNNAATSASLLAKLTYHISKRFEIQLTDSFTHRQQGIPGIGHFRMLHAESQSTQNLLQLSFKMKRFPTKMMNWNHSLYYLQQEEIYDPKSDPNQTGSANHTQPMVLGLKNHFQWLLDFQHELSISSHLRWENLSYPDTQRPSPSRWRWSPAAQILSTFYDEKLTLLAGGRLEVFQQAQKATSPGKSNPSQTSWNPTGRVGAKFQPVNFIRFQGNIGNYVRPATFWELFGNQGNMVGNDTLRPESGWMWDTGLVFTKKKWLPFLNRIRVSYSFFSRDTTDLIRFVQNSQRTMIAINIDRARFYGHEVIARLALWKLLFIQADLTWLHTTNLSKAKSERNKRLPGRPERELSLRGELRRPWGQIFYSYYYVANHFLDQANLKPLAPRHIHSLGFLLQPVKLLQSLGHRSPWSGLTITFEIKNLLDTRTENLPLNPPLPGKKEYKQAIADFAGYPLPGRSFYLTVRWDL